MSHKEISENWSIYYRSLSTSDFFNMVCNKAFAFLYGDGLDSRWLILGSQPLLSFNKIDYPLITIKRYGNLPPIFPDFIGYISYENNIWYSSFIRQHQKSLFSFPDCYLVIYKNIYLYDKWTETLYQGERSTVEQIQSFDNQISLSKKDFSAYKVWSSDTKKQYEEKIMYIRQQIAIGNVYQVNLTRQECWHFNGNVKQFAQRLFDINPAPFSAMIMDKNFSIVSSSPERFFKISDGKILTSPIKGTSARGSTYEEDLKFRQLLVNSIKDRSELAMIVDLLRNDITKVCQLPSVNVDNFPRLETYANVHHLVADISGKLLPNLSIASLFAAIFPGGSITGCPKLAAMSLIRELECGPRMIYTGALGWFSYDLQQADFNIPIRTVWLSDNILLFGVGGGIVWDSNPASEYQETIDKGKSIVKCLNL